MAFGEKQNAARVCVQTMDVAEKFQAARARPKIARGDGRRDGRLQIARRALPRMRHKHPATRLVNRDNRAVFIQNRNRLATRQFNEIGFGQSEIKSKMKLQSEQPLQNNFNLGKFVGRKLRNTPLDF